MRAPGNAGDKRVKRKRGSKSPAAVAARIERWYLKRTRTAGGTACVQNNHVDSRGTGAAGGSHPAAERTSSTARDGGDDTHKRKRKPCTVSAELDRHARTVRAGRSGRHTGDRQARPVRRRSDEVRGLVVQTEIVPRSRGSAVPARVGDNGSIVDTETQRNPRQRRKHSQHADVLHSGDDNYRRRVGQVYRFRDDIPTKLSEFERTVHDYENQSTKTVDDDIKIGVTMLGMEDMQVKEHLIRNSVRITSWNQMREEILEITRTQQYIDSQPMPMQLGGNPKSKGKGKDRKGKGKGKGKDIKGKDAKGDDQRKCFYCNK